MVEVIGQNEGAAKTITHKHCGAELRYYPKDIRPLHRGRDIGGGADGADGFTCPQCGENVITHSW